MGGEHVQKILMEACIQSILDGVEEDKVAQSYQQLSIPHVFMFSVTGAPV